MDSDNVITSIHQQSQLLTILCEKGSVLWEKHMVPTEEQTWV